MTGQLELFSLLQCLNIQHHYLNMYLTDSTNVSASHGLKGNQLISLTKEIFIICGLANCFWRLVKYGSVFFLLKGPGLSLEFVLVFLGILACLLSISILVQN